MDYKARLEQLLNTVHQEGGSDLHLVHGYKPTIRVNDILIPLVKEEELSREDAQGFMEALVTPENKERFLKNKELDFSYAFGDKARFRGNAYYSQGGIGIALRLIPHHVKTVAELNLPEGLRHFAQTLSRFFLVCWSCWSR